MYTLYTPIIHPLYSIYAPNTPLLTTCHSVPRPYQSVVPGQYDVRILADGNFSNKTSCPGDPPCNNRGVCKDVLDPNAPSQPPNSTTPLPSSKRCVCDADYSGCSCEVYKNKVRDAAASDTYALPRSEATTFKPTEPMGPRTVNGPYMQNFKVVFDHAPEV